MLRLVARLLVSFVVVGVSAPVAWAQSFGSFRWQLTPFCNIVTVSVTQTGGVFTLDGFDDQCGAATRASVVGTAFLNPDGTIGIGLSLVLTPGGAPVHVDIALSLATLGGPWRDSAGNTGTWVFNPATPAPGSPRPTTGGLGVASINPTQIQRRVTGVCPAGQAVRLVNQDGSVVCEGTGDITAVAAGTGLAGGGAAGDVGLAVNFGGPGVAATVARSDHTHAVTPSNVAIGPSALVDVTSGFDNTAVGSGVLAANTTGTGNTALGRRALDDNLSGDSNTAVGTEALGNIGSKDLNTAVGSGALRSLLTSSGNVAVGAASADALGTGDDNTAVGINTLGAMLIGSRNIAIGEGAGSVLTSGSDNIYIGHNGTNSENDIIRLGAASTHTATFIAGIVDRNVSGASDQPVLVDATGKLGTMTSSARVKDDVHPLGDASRALLRLEPVSFRYKPDQQRGSARQYGLIAEQVAEVMPDLVIHDEDGRALTVKYHVLPTLLLAEIQRLEHERAAQAKAIDELRDEVRALRDQRR